MEKAWKYYIEEELGINVAAPTAVLRLIRIGTPAQPFQFLVDGHYLNRLPGYTTWIADGYTRVSFTVCNIWPGRAYADERNLLPALFLQTKKDGPRSPRRHRTRQAHLPMLPVRHGRILRRREAEILRTVQGTRVHHGSPTPRAWNEHTASKQPWNLKPDRGCRWGVRGRPSVASHLNFRPLRAAIWQFATHDAKNLYPKI